MTRRDRVEQSPCTNSTSLMLRAYGFGDSVSFFCRVDSMSSLDTFELWISLEKKPQVAPCYFFWNGIRRFQYSSFQAFKKWILRVKIAIVEHWKKLETRRLRPVNQSINQSIRHATDQSINQSDMQPINQSINQTCNRSINQSIDRTGVQPISHHCKRSFSTPRVAGQCSSLPDSPVEILSPQGIFLTGIRNSPTKHTLKPRITITKTRIERAELVSFLKSNSPWTLKNFRFSHLLINPRIHPDSMNNVTPDKHPQP